MNEVYIVTQGWYSDYKIVAVFDNDEAANTLAHAIDGRVEIYEVNSVSPIPPGMKVYRATFSEGRWEARERQSLEHVGETNIWHFRGHSGYHFSTYCLARDEQHALKIGSERHAFMVATYGTEVDSEHDFGGNDKNER